MTLGMDMSALFPYMIMAASTRDLIVKKVSPSLTLFSLSLTLNFSSEFLSSF